MVMIFFQFLQHLHINAVIILCSFANLVVDGAYVFYGVCFLRFCPSVWIWIQSFIGDIGWSYV